MLGKHLLEEGIAQHDIINAGQADIINDVPVNEEEDGKVNRFPGPNLLLFEAEALDFRKVWCHLFVQGEVSLKSTPRGEYRHTLEGVVL